MVTKKVTQVTRMENFSKKFFQVRLCDLFMTSVLYTLTKLSEKTFLEQKMIL